jgi:hypothetical protein
MLIAEARVETARSSRYLVQLCQHVNKVSEANPQMRAHVEWSDDHGVISFGWGRCTLHADPGALTLRAEAPDEESLQRIEHRVAERLEGFGRRDQLMVTWTPPQGAVEQLPGRRPRPTRAQTHMAGPHPYPETSDDTRVESDREPPTRRARWGQAILIIALGLLLVFVIVMHLIFGGFRGIH